MAKTPDISSMKSKNSRNWLLWPKSTTLRVGWVMLAIVIVVTVVASVAFTPVGGLLSGLIVAVPLAIIYFWYLVGLVAGDAILAVRKAAKK